MPIPAWAAGFVLVNVGGFIISELLDPRPLADDDLGPGWGNGPKPRDPNGEPPKPSEDIRRYPTEKPICWEPPRLIYEVPNLTGEPPPELPPRRLPTEGDDQTAYQTAIGQVFTISEWIQWREFGHLLWNPLNEKPLIIRQGFSRDADEEFRTALEEGKRKYEKWLYAQLDFEYAQSEEYLADYNFWDGTAWVFPDRLKGLQGNLTINFGMDALQKLGAVFSIHAQNAHIGIIDSIPNGYEVRTAELPPSDRLSAALNNLEFLGDQSLLELLGGFDFPVTVPKDLTGLPSFEEFLKAGIDDRKLDEEFFNKQGDKSYNIEPENLTPEQLEEALGKEYQEKYYRKLNNLVEFISWQAAQLDGLLGAFPIEIDIQDTDLITEGNQSQKVTLPNIAETLAELMGNSINNEKYTEALMNLCLRTLQEIGSSKSQGVATHSAIEGIVDYLGFKIKKIDKKVNFTYNPTVETEEGKELDISKFLEPKELKVAVEEYDDDISLEMQLKELMEAARIIKAKMTRRVDLNNIDSLKGLFKNSLAVLDLFEDEETKSKFEEFLEKFEDGFTSESGIQDPSRPWGRDRTQRPRVREIGKNG